MMLVELDDLSSQTLSELASLARERENRERQEREELIARAAELLDRPTIGYYRRQRAGASV
jgi:hypothetical protein